MDWGDGFGQQMSVFPDRGRFGQQMGVFPNGKVACDHELRLG